MPGPTDRTSLADRLAVAFLIPAGALAGHAAAYGLVGSHAHAHAHGEPGHAYLAAVAAVAVPLALAALVWHACQGASRGRGPTLGPLLVAQPLLFLGQEGLEHLLSGYGIASLARSPAVRVGLAAQIIVAAMTLLLVRAARATGRAVLATLLRTGAHWPPRPSVRRPPPATSAVSRARRTRVSERGPPSLPALA